MDVTITQPCDVRLDGVVKSLQAWTRLNLPEDKAQKLIDAGYAKEEPFDSTHWQQEIRALFADFGKQDPRAGIWAFMAREYPELWQAHQTAVKELDFAYQAKDGARVVTAKSKALDAFNACLSAWQCRNEMIQQPALLSA